MKGGKWEESNKGKEWRKEYCKKWKSKNKQKVALWQKKRQKEYFRDWMDNVIIPRGYNKCSRCGYDKCFFAIDFHHRNAKEKTYQIGPMIRQKITPKRLSEFEKVIPLCRNCHAEEHWEKIQIGGTMGDYAESIGEGVLWLHTSKKGTKFMSGSMVFQYNGHPVEAKILIFKNTRKRENSKDPDYVIKVTDAAPAKARDVPKPKEAETWDPDKDSLPF